MVFLKEARLMLFIYFNGGKVAWYITGYLSQKQPSHAYNRIEIQKRGMNFYFFMPLLTSFFR